MSKIKQEFAELRLFCRIDIGSSIELKKFFKNNKQTRGKVYDYYSLIEKEV